MNGNVTGKGVVVQKKEKFCQKKTIAIFTYKQGLFRRGTHDEKGATFLYPGAGAWVQNSVPRRRRLGSEKWLLCTECPPSESVMLCGTRVILTWRPRQPIV